MECNRTVLFADVRDSTGLTEQLGDVESRQLIGSLMQELGSITEAHDGSVIKTIGDEIMAVFDDACAAAKAAVHMQRDMTRHAPVGGHPIQIGIGLNAGPVVIEEGDVFGDVVIVAARLVGTAMATQILTTQETLEAIDDEDIACRSLGAHVVKGREEPVHLCEILWRGETAQLTTVGPKLAEVPRSSLKLALGTEIVERSSDAMQPLQLGRSADCSLVVPGESASRKHATITSRGGRFYLIDHSTNGTWVLQANGDELVVHRDEVLLVASGHIRLGDPITEAGPLDIAFEVTGG